MNKYKRLGKNTFLVFIGNTGSKLIALVMLPFYTSWLSVEDYGVTDIINVYVSFFFFFFQVLFLYCRRFLFHSYCLELWMLFLPCMVFQTALRIIFG